MTSQISTMTSTWTLRADFSIQTERLHISYLEPGNHLHSTFLHELWNTDEFVKAEGKTGLDTPEKAGKFIDTQVQVNYKRNGYGQMLVSLKPYPEAPLACSKPIGIVSLMKGLQGYTAPDVGYTIFPSECGKGYATEAVIGLIAYAKRELGVDGVLGFCDVKNMHSRRILEKIGMQFRGERHLRAFGGAHSAVYSLPEMRDLKDYGIEDDV